MNIGTLAKGYYKVFVKINGKHIGIIYINMKIKVIMKSNLTNK
jgi:hypothetical protein